jgi:hypothetical protein
MNQFEEFHNYVVDAIFKVIKLYYQQGKTTTWREIFLFLQLSSESYEDMLDLDEHIIINSEEDLDIMQAMIASRFAVKH